MEKTNAECLEYIRSFPHKLIPYCKVTPDEIAEYHRCISILSERLEELQYRLQAIKYGIEGR